MSWRCGRPPSSATRSSGRPAAARRRAVRSRVAASPRAWVRSTSRASGRAARMRAQAARTGAVSLARLLKQPKVMPDCAGRQRRRPAAHRAAAGSRDSRPAGAAAARCRRARSRAASPSGRSASSRRPARPRVPNWAPTHFTCTGAGRCCSTKGRPPSPWPPSSSRMSMPSAAMRAAMAASSSAPTSCQAVQRARKRWASGSVRGRRL